MKIIEPGHIYELDEINTNHKDGPTHTFDGIQTIRYINNEGPQFYNGTQSQELLRVLIDRTMHCDNCLRWPSNDKIIYHLRMALVLHEARALERKTEKGKIEPEHITLSKDGHFNITHLSNQVVSADYMKYLYKDKK